MRGEEDQAHDFGHYRIVDPVPSIEFGVVVRVFTGIEKHHWNTMNSEAEMVAAGEPGPVGRAFLPARLRRFSASGRRGLAVDSAEID